LTKLETGKIVLAGLIKEQAESVMAAYRPFFPDIHEANTKDDWSLLVGTRNNVPVTSIV
jgi:ribosomal protein L11 methylase PrmA